MELVSMTRYLTKSALPPVLIRRQHLWFVLAGPVSLTRCCVRDLTQRARRQAAGLVAAPRRQREPHRPQCPAEPVERAQGDSGATPNPTTNLRHQMTALLNASRSVPAGMA